MLIIFYIYALVTLACGEYSAGVRDKNETKYLKYYAHILEDRIVQCAGSIISSKFVLTAASCYYKGSKYAISIGDISRNLDEKASDIAQFIIHEGFNNNTYENNIALIQLGNKYRFVPSQMISLAQTKPSPGVSLTVLGFSYSSANPHADILMESNVVEMATDDECAEFSKKYAYRAASEHEFCVKNSPNALASTAGGPAIVDDTLVGFVSQIPDQECPDNRCKVIYTDVVSYRSWINEKTGLFLR